MSCGGPRLIAAMNGQELKLVKVKGHVVVQEEHAVKTEESGEHTSLGGPMTALRALCTFL